MINVIFSMYMAHYFRIFQAAVFKILKWGKAEAEARTQPSSFAKREGERREGLISNQKK